jgi:hypothetical protein
MSSVKPFPEERLSMSGPLVSIAIAQVFLRSAPQIKEEFNPIFWTADYTI